MRSLFAFFAVLPLALCIPAAAHAAEPSPDPSAQAPAPSAHEDCSDDADGPPCPELRFELGARTGYSFSLGGLASGTNVSDLAEGQVPLWIDAGLRLDPHWYVGAFGSLGYAVPGQSFCQPGANCSGSDVRVGIQAHYRFLPGKRLDPWIGVGAGYEWLSVSESVGQRSLSATVDGFELANIQAGADYHVARGVSVGPFAALSFGEYRNESASAQADGITAQRSLSIDDQAVHEWLTVGVRGEFGF